MRKSKWLTLWATVLALSLAAAIGAVWACTGQSQFVGLSTRYGPPGTSVEVRGQALWGTYGNGRPAVAEIRWNDLQGPVVGSAAADASGNFTTAIRVPDVSPGIYSLIIAVAEGTNQGVARSAFEVTPTQAAGGDGPVPPTAAQRVASDLWEGFSDAEAAPVSSGVNDAKHESEAIRDAGLALSVLGLTVPLLAGSVIALKRRGHQSPRRRTP